MADTDLVEDAAEAVVAQAEAENIAVVAKAEAEVTQTVAEASVALAEQTAAAAELQAAETIAVATTEMELWQRGLLGALENQTAQMISRLTAMEQQQAEIGLALALLSERLSSISHPLTAPSDQARSLEPESPQSGAGESPAPRAKSRRWI